MTEHELPSPHRRSGADAALDLLDALEGMVVNARRVPLTRGVIVDEDDALDSIDRARVALPEDIKRAHALLERQEEVVARAAEHARLSDAEAAERAAAVRQAAQVDSEALLAAARAEADRVLREATARAATLVDTHAITESATERARQMEASAAAEAQRYRAEADAYAREVLEGVTATLARAQQTVQKGIGALGEPRR